MQDYLFLPKCKTATGTDDIIKILFKSYQRPLYHLELNYKLSKRYKEQQINYTDKGIVLPYQVSFTWDLLSTWSTFLSAGLRGQREKCFYGFSIVPIIGINIMWTWSSAPMEQIHGFQQWYPIDVILIALQTSQTTWYIYCNIQLLYMKKICMWRPLY